MTHRTVFMFPAQSRTDRLTGARNGSVPHEFFYGYIALQDAGYEVDMADSRSDPKSPLGRGLLQLEIRRNALVGFGYSLQRVLGASDALTDSTVAISFTDGFSLSLGLYGHRVSQRPTLVGGFHGLADTVDFVPRAFRQATHRRIKRAAAGLDHLFFFGDQDRLQSIKRFGIPPEKTSLYRFGVDTDFWSPGSARNGSAVLAVGSDPKRDYATLIAARCAAPLTLLTRLPIKVPADRQVSVVHGSYHGSPITDIVLRDMYRSAAVVVVPLLDVWQPTGYSVTLQAMACGRPVVLSNIKGLWDRNLFHDGSNCILVPPGDPAKLAQAVERLRSDPQLCERMGVAARATAEKHFSMGRMNRDTRNLVECFGGKPAARPSAPAVAAHTR